MADRTRDCTVCGLAFTYTIGTGKDRWICSDFCRAKRRKELALSQTPCVTPGCGRPRQYAEPPVCNSCYYRLRRTGTTEKRKCQKAQSCA